MISLRLVMDTNVIVSAILRPQGLERTVVLLAARKPAHWYVSEPIFAEYASVLARPKLRIARAERKQILDTIKQHRRVVVPSRLDRVTADPADNIFIECADAARADYLVTGNRRHFPKFWKTTKIIGSRDFLTIVAPHLIW